jgi:hypothetical protein
MLPAKDRVKKSVGCGHQERGSYTFSGDVAQGDGEFAVGQGNQVKEIAADFAARA